MKAAVPAVILAAALGVSARPSEHAHQHVHRSVEARNEFVKYVRPEPVAAPAPVPAAPSPDVVAASSNDESSSSSNSGNSNNDNSSGSPAVGGECPAEPKGGWRNDFCNGPTKRATLDDIMYAGNVGSEGDYGCNLKIVDAKVAQDYKYLIEMENVSNEDNECACFLKIGPDGGVNGFFDGNEVFKMTLPAGATKFIAAEANTQMGCDCGAGELPLTGFGQFAGTWLEADFENEKNKGWSGADASCLVAAANKMDIPGMNICGHGTCSTIYPGGTGVNAFLAGMEEEDGWGLNIVPGCARLHVEVGYSG